MLVEEAGLVDKSMFTQVRYYSICFSLGFFAILLVKNDLGMFLFSKV